jgi:hypothetical protein
MLELIRVEGNDLANSMHGVGLATNAVFVRPVDTHISGTTVLFEGKERVVRSVSKASYQCTGGDVLVVRFKPLPVKRLQGKDLSTETILQFLATHSGPYKWTSWWANLPDKDWGDWSIANQFPAINRSNEVVLLRKMGRLIKKGYVAGCACGCRGDFYLLPKGAQRLQQLKESNA